MEKKIGQVTKQIQEHNSETKVIILELIRHALLEKSYKNSTQNWIEVSEKCLCFWF